jgi:hypothetical protein
MRKKNMTNKLFFDAGHIDEATGNSIWCKMIEKRRRLPKATFTEYLRTFK